MNLRFFYQKTSHPNLTGKSGQILPDYISVFVSHDKSLSHSDTARQH